MAQSLGAAFKNAFNGMAAFFLNDRNGKIHLAFIAALIVCGFVFGISKQEWISILTCIAIVMALEMANASIEKLCDTVHPSIHPNIKWIKDVAAAAVLWAAIFSAIIGLIVFVPKLLEQL
jgi:diacylglycerol kinase